ncbi:MAG: cysteine desulfurase [Clostridia bacterium]|nr:cysteine desulfurase [Clostridia bacterium]
MVINMIYLDNAATTKPSEAAAVAMMKVVEEFGNPSSLHGAGLRAEKLINTAKQTIAAKLGGSPRALYFTSGGTEANNLAVIGAARARRRGGERVIVSAIEHPSVLEAARQLEREGFDVRFAPVTGEGRVDTDAIKALITPETVVVSVMHVNNETGVIQPVEEIASAVKKAAPKAVLHCDCVQSFGKLPININRLGADLISISAHKIHGFKGVGALYMKDPRVSPIIHGGEQQQGIRPGTENIGGILAFAAAAAECHEDVAAMKKKRALMAAELAAEIGDIQINGSEDHNSGSVLNVSIMGIKAEILLHALERDGVYISTGSACSSHKPQPSHVLTAMGVPQRAITGAVRISFSAATTEEEIKTAARAIAKETAEIRRYM